MPGTDQNKPEQLLDPVVETLIYKMYNTTTTSNSFNDSDDSKYTVADILSSMASGEPMNTNYTSTTALVNSGSTVVSTPLLTPTTLATLEQTFIELQSVPSSTTAQDLSRQSGFVPPLVDPSTSEYGDYGESGSDKDPDWMPGSKRVRTEHGGVIVTAGSSTGVITSTPRRNPGPGRRGKNEKNNDEDPKKSLRRERNKLAAARCRQRRVDLTNKLITETDNLEEQQAELQNEIQTLQQQKEQLEFLLQAHKPMCSVKELRSITIKSEPIDVKESFSQNPADLRINVKPDPETVKATTAVSRPMSLPLSTSSSSVTEATGVSINTPSSVLLGLESMMDGHTGLTPLVSGPTCASQVHRASTDSSSGNENGLSSPTTLVAL